MSRENFIEALKKWDAGETEFVELTKQQAVLNERLGVLEKEREALEAARDAAFDAAGGVAIGAFPSHGSNTIQVWRGSITSWSRSTPIFIEKEKAPLLESCMDKATEALKQLETLGVVKPEDMLVYYVSTGEHLERVDGAEWQYV